MRKPDLTLPVLALIAATRGLLGVGLGLLLSTRIAKNRRVIVGGALASLGALSTIPLVLHMYRRHDHVPEQQVS